MKTAMLAIVSLLLFRTSHAAPGYIENPAKTHFVYLVPLDKQPIGTLAIQHVAQHLQRWYRDHMKSGKTFTLTNPVVAVYATSHPSDYYAVDYRNKVMNDAALLAGAGLCQAFDDWVIYIDAEPGPNEVAGGVGCLPQQDFNAGGTAVLGHKDLMAAMAVDPDWTQCREYGGAGHELGHSFNLHHPVYQPWTTELMGVGYTVYPRDDVFLTNGVHDPLPGPVSYYDQPRLDSISFFSIVPEGILAPPFDCSNTLPPPNQ